MAQLYIHDIGDELAQAYLNASKAEQQQIKQSVEDAIACWIQTSKSPQRWLQKGNQTPFKPFKLPNKTFHLPKTMPIKFLSLSGLILTMIPIDNGESLYLRLATAYNNWLIRQLRHRRV